MNNNNTSSRNRTNTLLKWGISAWIPLVLLTAVFSILQPHPAYAATIVVDTTADEYNTSGSGAGCSLREAIEAANNDAAFGGCTAGSGDDIITLPAGTYTLSITGIGEEDNATGDLDIDSNITINGASAGTTIIDGADIDRVIHILNTADATLNKLTVQNGSINSGNDAYDIGGGIYHQSSGQLTLSTVHVLDNFANFSGGGFANAGNATVTDCTISENRSGEWGAGISNLNSAATMTISNTVVSTNTVSGVGRGGGLNIDAGSVVIENSLFTGNVVTLTTFVEGDIDFGNGGGISNNDRLTITNSTITNNSAARYGGGIFTFNTAAYTGSSVTISNSTISNNRTSGYNRDLSDNGGGIYISWGTVHITNSTISGNRTNGGGSGIFAFGQGDNGRATLTIDNSTIANNVGSTVITYTYRAGVAMHNGTVHFDHTIMSNNAPFNCQEGNGEMTDDGHNLEYSGTISDTTCSTETGTTWTVQTNPNLGPLADNGGPTTASGQATFTHALLSGSAAIDAGGASCGVTTDQRGYTRPNNNCDIGAYEVQPPAPEIDVQRPSPTSIPNNSTDNVGSQTTNTFNVTYVISNTGQLPLVITDTTATNFNNSGNFTVITAMPFTVTAGMTSSLQISFTATTSGAFSFDMDIENNDSNENPYNITVAGAFNTPPVANGDAYDAIENNTLTIAASGVLSNDTDAETNSLTAVLDTNPTHGSLSLASDGGFTYTPATDYCGADSFTYHANDSMDDSNTATVTLNVICTQELTVGSAGTGSGSVTSDPTGINCGVDCSQGYLDGTAVTLTAAPNASTSTFTGWTGACSGTGDCHVTMTETKAVTATFALISRTLTVGIDGSGGGSVSSSPAGISCEGDCSESYNHGTAVTLSPTAVSGSSFTGWAGACTGDGACVVSMTAAQHVTATFILGTDKLTVQKIGMGDGRVTSSPTGIDCGTDCSQVYSNGTAVTLSAAPDNDSTFIEWGGACSGSGSCVVTMSTAQNVTALFSLLHPSGTIDVNTTDDEYDTNTARCSLREAIHSANTDTAFGGCNSGNGDDTIALPAGTYTLTRSGADEDNNATGDLDITSNITIAGNGTDITLIDGNNSDRVIHTHGSNNLTINNATIQNGNVTGSNHGGGLYHESDGNLTLYRVAILDNFAGHRGGGLENAGNATLTNCTISGNESDYGGGLVSATGGAVTTVANCIVSTNTAHVRGGGLNIYEGTVHVKNSLFVSNTVDLGGEGGGIANRDRLDVTNSTFSLNTARGNGNGGGIYIESATTITNSTISGNDADAGNGDGIYTLADLALSHNSIVYNNGTGIFQAGGTVAIDNSIVANNTTANCGGTFTDNGHNLEYPGTTCGGFTVQTNPLLGSLADNGGYLIGADMAQSIPTHALPKSSSAFDAGSCGTFVTDQRGFSRPQYTACDIGSFELQKPAPEMDVQRPSSTSIPDGGSDDLGSSLTTAYTLTYLIDNSKGTQSLYITNTTTANPHNIADFTIITPMPMTIASGDTANLTISFTVPAAGAFSVDMIIANNDENEDPYNITITGAVNTPPVAVNDAYTTTKGSTLTTAAAAGVLQNDTDAESHGLTAVLNNNVSHGSLTLGSDGGFTYTPAADFCGTDNFTYHANDGMSDSNIATVTLNVNCVTSFTVYLPIVVK